ncbi:hypothetical protein BCL32_1674 [Rhizobium mongolense USDA 1844]|uniref:Uncharacterized protein n=2 Tax=Rhizobium mongolense TaxID=57676 RepID=A0A559TFT9_9HYPH|nr:hypothetical protein BCL32_1674 [Rhizobium mongolense USDA 1844]
MAARGLRSGAAQSTKFRFCDFKTYPHHARHLMRRRRMNPIGETKHEPKRPLNPSPPGMSILTPRTGWRMGTPQSGDILSVASTHTTAGREPDFLLGMTAGMKQIGQRAKPNLELLSEAKPDIALAAKEDTAIHFDAMRGVAVNCFSGSGSSARSAHNSGSSMRSDPIAGVSAWPK